MLEIVRTLEERRNTGKSLLIQVVVKCKRCGSEHKMLKQNAVKHNKRGSQYCQECIKDRHPSATKVRMRKIWRGILSRCHDPAASGYKHYGGRGISVCERWLDFGRFYEDMRDGHSRDLTIERIDVDGDYSKENCRWATNMEQQANKRNNRVLTYKGRSMHLAELCRRTGVSKMKMRDRLAKGMTPEEAVASARASTYGKGRWAQKYGKGRMSTISSTAGQDHGS